ncbi:hypothetical protein AK812_SmicGene37175 [Symbiodinium microadriaticum]|uniref:Uncharacterized protein n=1 Tax=Symbiodinium microadriaticum TaxID=2951 RepID=A0A1Q9CGZ1_SYMMI|nr:hypothetical protein AK812_SmicGene37175 [Symbiodinium microadriaticum]
MAVPICKIATDHVWFDTEYFVPLLIDCWMEEMRLQLNVTASITSALELEDEAQGVHVHTVSYGSIKDSLFDYGIFHGGTGVWTPIIAQLEKLGFNASHLPLGYAEKRAMMKRQHDWPRLKTFLEEKEHLASFFSFSGVFGGTVGGLGLAMLGDARPLGRSHAAYDLKVDFASRETCCAAGEAAGGACAVGASRSLLRGVSMLLPRIHADTAFIQLPPNFKGNVTWDNLDEALGRVSTEFAALYELLTYKAGLKGPIVGPRLEKRLYYPISGHPGVKTHCFFGSALRSPAQYVYRSTPRNASESKSLMDQGLEAAEQLGRGKKPDLMSLLGGIGKLAEEFIEPAPLGEVLKSRDDYWVQQLPMLLKKRFAFSQEQPHGSFGASGTARECGVVGLRWTDGDGLVPRESLAICEAWAQAEDPSLAAEIHEVKGRSHGSELFDPEVLLAVRASVAKVVGVKNPNDRKHGLDLPRPLEEFEAILGPQPLADWSATIVDPPALSVQFMPTQLLREFLLAKADADGSGQLQLK